MLFLFVVMPVYASQYIKTISNIVKHMQVSSYYIWYEVHNILV